MNQRLLAGRINEISCIKVVDKHFNYSTMEPDANVWVTELLPDRVKVYRKLKGQKGKVFQDQVDVPAEKMSGFFSKVYGFIRSAEYIDTPMDDTDHSISIYYNPYHKEIFKDNPCKDNEGLLWIIQRFTESTGITTFESHMCNSD